MIVTIVQPQRVVWQLGASTATNDLNVQEQVLLKMPEYLT